jgi:signal transduction histidine kinase
VSNALKFTPRHGVVSLCVFPVLVEDDGLLLAAPDGSFSEFMYCDPEDGSPGLDISRHSSNCSHTRGSHTSYISPTGSDTTIATTRTTGGAGGEGCGCGCMGGCMGGACLNFADRPNGVVRPHVPRAARRVRFEIRDSGVGIAPENIVKLFTEGTQFDAATLQSGGGSGLGLWIAKQIIALHGGKIGVSSIHNEGSVFCAEVDEYKMRDTVYDFVDRSHTSLSASFIKPEFIKPEVSYKNIFLFVC